MNTNAPITLSRDCEVIEIPDGNKVTLPAGTEVMITQALGGTYTLRTDRGYLVRIAAQDTDAIGVENVATSQPEAAPVVDGTELEKLVWEQLKTVYDPEIPVNVVDLGLVYLCQATPLPDGGHNVKVRMTLTAPGCGMGDVLKSDAQSKISRVPGVSEVEVEIVLDPPWDQSMMSEEAKFELGIQ